MSTPLDIDAVVLINEALSGNRCSEEGRQRVGGCLSSYSYYGTVPEQITSIVVSLLKGHFFQDGNKRTALAVYLDLCQNNGIRSLRRRFYRHRSHPARHHGKRSVTLSGLKREIRSQARPMHDTCSIVAQSLRDSCSISTQFQKIGTLFDIKNA